MRLELMREEHLADFAATFDDPDVKRFTRLPSPAPPGYEQVWFARYEAGRADGTREAFAIVDDDGAFVGSAMAPDINRGTGTVELGYLVAPAARGRGVATEALRQMTEWARGEGLAHIELLISADNVASQKVAERCGYARTGEVREEEACGAAEVWVKNGV